MADITVTAAQVGAVFPEKAEIVDMIAAEALTAGQPVYQVAASGKAGIEDDKEKKNGKPVIDLEAFDAFSNGLDELLDGEEIQIESYITLAQIERLGLEPAMSPDEMALLWWLIKEFQEDTTIEDD